MRMKLNLIVVLLVGALSMATSCQNKKQTNSPTMGVAKIICEESFQNIMDQEIQVFEYQYPEASILCRYQDESSAFDSLLNKTVDLIVTSRDLTPRQRDYLKSQGRAFRSRKIAVDAIAIIANKENDIEELSMSELEEIFSGKTRIWGKVTPTRALRNDSIQLVFDSNASGVVHYIRDKFLKGALFPFPVYAQKSTESVFKAVEAHKNAIGFVGVSWISDDMTAQMSMDQKVTKLNSDSSEPVAVSFTDRIKVMKVRAENKLEGCKPYQVYINSGDYPLFRVIYAIDASASGTLDHGFFAFLTGVIGQKIILLTGVMPAAEPVRTVQLN